MTRLKKKTLEFIFLIGFYLLFQINHYAQESTNDTIDIHEVVITGTKTEVSRNQVPLTISIIDSHAIESNSESALLPVLSELVPGMFVTERGVTGFGVATGAAGQITMRGIGASPNTQVLVLLNGNPQYMGLFGHPMADAYLASDVERVEVIRGPGSALYGSNAMGGVINIITKRPKRDFYSASARIMYGSYNTQKYMINGGLKKNKFSAFAGINYDKTDGHRDSSGFDIMNAYSRINYTINPHFSSSVDFSIAQFNATDPGRFGETAGETIHITRGMGAFAINNDFEKITGSLRLFYNLGEHEITDGFRSTDHNWGIVFYQSLKLLRNNSLTIGMDYKNLGGMAKNKFAMNGAGLVFADTSSYELAGYLLMQQKLFSRLTVNAGFRMDYSKFSGYEPIPTAGFAFQASASTTLKASIAKGFRNPTIRELFMWAPANDKLKAEQMINYEFGANQSFWKNKVTTEIVVYKSEGNNLIQKVPSGNQEKYENTGEFSNWGLELSIKLKLIKSLDLQASYSFLTMKTPVIAAPEGNFFISGNYQYKRISLNMSFQNITGLYIQTGDTPIKESYGILNSRLSCNFAGFSMFLKAENILDEKYQINNAYPMPGITMLGGIQVSISK